MSNSTRWYCNHGSFFYLLSECYCVYVLVRGKTRTSGLRQLLTKFQSCEFDPVVLAFICQNTNECGSRATVKWEAVFQWILAGSSKAGSRNTLGHLLLSNSLNGKHRQINPISATQSGCYEGMVSDLCTECESTNVFHKFLMLIGSTAGLVNWLASQYNPLKASIVSSAAWC